MIKSLFWSVPLRGFHWRQCPREGPKGRAIALIPKRSEPVRIYNPADETPGLFRSFVTIENTREGICVFANQFGTIGMTENILNPDYEPEEFSGNDESRTEFDLRRKRDFFYGDWHSDWDRELRAMKKAVDALDRLKTEAVPEDEEDDAPQIEDIINDGLRRTDVRSLLLKDSKRNQLAIHHAPTTLAGLMWTQIASAVAGGKEFRQCPSCARWLEISGERCRSNQYYCGEKCRVRAYRRRKDEALKLATSGLRPEQIAKKLSVDVASIRRWQKNETNV